MIVKNTAKKPKTIDCVGVDRRLHKCYAWSSTTKCGVKVLRKKLLINDISNLFSCYECTY